MPAQAAAQRTRCQGFGDGFYTSETCLFTFTSGTFSSLLEPLLFLIAFANADIAYSLIAVYCYVNIFFEMASEDFEIGKFKAKYICVLVS